MNTRIPHSRLICFFWLAASILSAPPARARVTTGSFVINDGFNTLPTLYELRQGPDGTLISASFLWDTFYEILDAEFSEEGNLIAFTANMLGPARFDLEVGELDLPEADANFPLTNLIRQSSPDPFVDQMPRLKINQTSEGLRLSAALISNRGYQLESTSDLVNPWTILQDIRDDLDILIALDAPRRFYRLTAPVVINGAKLGVEELQVFDAVYGGIRPPPGRYWYDSTSGLYGVEGYPSYGFMLPGHDFGELPSNASIGNTQVFLNGRELPISEWWVWSMIVFGAQPGTSWPQNIIPAGSYWMDDQGNTGVGATPSELTMTGNLYQSASESGYAGQGASGDNFWSSRFSAGNYDASQGVGYVSVPGVGPVGFGF